MTRSILAIMIVAILGGCSTLPRDGPSGRAINSGANDATPGAATYAIVELDYATAERIKSAPGEAQGSIAAASSSAPVDTIGVGDQLAVAIYEPSGSLFGGGTGDNVRSGNQALPLTAVDRAGTITIPFAGPVRVAGMTTTEAASAIQRALRGRVGNPQVTVALGENLSNTVTILGEVKNPGRAPLMVNGDTILDAIAAVGGAARPIEDIQVQIRRDTQTYSAPLSLVTTDFNENIRLQRGDQINLVYVPRRFRTFGALGVISEADMPAGQLSLAGALSRASGLDDNFANARSVLVFRFERPEVAQALGLTQPPTNQGVPVVYRLNLEQGSGFFTANAFAIQPNDTIYVPRATSAEVRKFFEMVQQITRVVYDISVTNTFIQ